MVYMIGGRINLLLGRAEALDKKNDEPHTYDEDLPIYFFLKKITFWRLNGRYKSTLRYAIASFFLFNENSYLWYTRSSTQTFHDYE